MSERQWYPHYWKPGWRGMSDAEVLEEILDVDPARLDLALNRWDDEDAHYVAGVAGKVLNALAPKEES